MQSVGSSRAAPVPGLQRREVPAQLTSPRHEQQRGPGSSRSDSSARLGVAAAAAPARPPGAAHSPSQLRPPARRGSVRAHLAGLPSLSGTLRSRTRPRPQPGPDSPPGKGAEKRASQLANERASGTHPPRPPPSPATDAARARGLRAPARHARTRPRHTPTARRGYTLPATRRQWALNKCPSDPLRTCALEPDRLVTPLHPHPKIGTGGYSPKPNLNVCLFSVNCKTSQSFFFAVVFPGLALWDGLLRERPSSAPGRERKPESSGRQGREFGEGDRDPGRAAGTRSQRKRKREREGAVEPTFPFSFWVNGFLSIL